MKNLRTATIVDRPRDPETFVSILKRKGFKFDRETCPVKITKPWDIVDEGDNGVLTYRQWDE